MKITSIAGIAAAVVMSASSAQAGHYRLPLANFITQEETTLLMKAGIDTTLSLLEGVKTQAQRKRVAQVTGITMTRIEALAGQVDLLRVDGIGPTVVRLLNAAGVTNSRGLANESTDALHARITAANAANQITNASPRAVQVAAWIEAAKRLGPALDGVH